ncbi:hypothetical protein Ancab_002436 [Ancistrocladus abbreviatus]
MDPQSSTFLISGDQKGCDDKDSGQVKLCCPSDCINECLAELADAKQANSGRKEQYSDVHRSLKDGFVEKEDSEEDRDMNLGASATLSQQPEFFEEGPVIDVKFLENEPWILSSTKCSEIQFMSYIGHVSEQQQPGDSFSEVSHLHCSMLRRCLQFDENQQQCAVDGLASFPKPPGIGLHLNSIVPVRSVSHEIENAQSPESILKGKDLVFITKNHLTNDVNASSTSSEVGKVFSSSKIEMLESKASKAGIPRKLVCQNTLKSSSIAILPWLSDNHAPSYGKRKYNSELSESAEAVNQASPKRKRTKASTNDGEDCRRCNCKKSKCLKLYCDCFATGFYCAESCACKGCFNRPDYEDTVLKVRQQIESQNPEAFAPKVVQSVTNSLANSVEVGNCVTPPSLKHKRGCNCKKSMCRKKYCECYQANVGCSDGYRCEDCRNVFGKREGGQSLVHDEWVSFFNYSTLCTVLLDSSMSPSEASNWLGDLRYDVGAAFIMLVEMRCNLNTTWSLAWVEKAMRWSYWQLHDVNAKSEFLGFVSSGKGFDESSSNYGMVKGITSRRVTKEVSEDRLDDKLEMFVRDDLLQDKVYDFQRLTLLTLLTPSLQSKNAPSKLIARRYVLSTNSDLSMSHESYQTPQRYSYRDAMLLDCGGESIHNPLRPLEDPEDIHDGLVNACHFTSYLNPIPTTMVASAYSNGSDLRNISQSTYLLLSSSRHWRSLPITHLGGSKYVQDLELSSKHCDIIGANIPDILKD